MSNAPEGAHLKRPRGKRFYILVALGVATLHCIIWLNIWGILFARADFYGSRAPPSPILSTMESVLGAPLFFLPESWSLALRPVFGDDSTILIVQAILNALIWGGAVAAALHFAQRHYAVRSLGS